MRIELGNNLEVLKTMPDNSVDSIVTDPPYGLSFMNKKWDYDVPSTELWVECLRVLKPGGHLLSFSGSRTYHRMVVRIEDAGFEIRDQIMWVYGSGFPKSHNIGKAVDKLLGNDREVIGTQTSTDIKGGNLLNSISDKGIGTYKIDVTKGTSEWEGWGTALKPAHEPIVLARKPLSEKSVAENVLRWGTGGINIDDSRIGTEEMKQTHRIDFSTGKKTDKSFYEEAWRNGKYIEVEPQIGRWPANIIFDEEAGQVLDQQSGISKSTASEWKYNLKTFHNDGRTIKEMEGISKGGFNDKGGASRFFYCPKASKKDRDEGLDKFEDKESSVNLRQQGGLPKPEIEYKVKNHHPTVKPTALMEYLIKLITPANGIVMDPFMGSGSTGKAAVRNGYDFIGIEMDEEYIKIAEARIKNELNG
jgi:DNA modification methylase